MAEAIIDALEAVEVDQQNGMASSVRRTLQHGVVEHLTEVAAVRQAREGVKQSKVARGAFRLVAKADFNPLILNAAEREDQRGKAQEAGQEEYLVQLPRLVILNEVFQALRKVEVRSQREKTRRRCQENNAVQHGSAMRPGADRGLSIGAAFFHLDDRSTV
ncbi:hypothetical protein [Terrihabitans rhizophilus]|uniref:hypothetical protein n=1 Tax=Terrihabitans rhizophilus TaxID=3092662 RepID=UPI0029DE84ED|nr:hypothetical protein [Terrihabitans sp. PJ23]